MKADLESLLDAHVILLVLSCCGSVMIIEMNTNEPRHEKTCFSHIGTTKVQIMYSIEKPAHF